jgi:hypothetical protein
MLGPGIGSGSGKTDPAAGITFLDGFIGNRCIGPR